MKISGQTPTYNPMYDVKKDIEKGDPKNTQNGKTAVDTYAPSKETAKITYDKPTGKVDTETIERLKAESNRTLQNLRTLVKQLLERQGLSFLDAFDSDIVVKIDEETRAEAQAAISEGGELSAENVSDNIVAFAKAISGGDPSKLDALKDAINKGFEAAEEVFGGKLPEISYETYDLVMEKLDAWVGE